MIGKQAAWTFAAQPDKWPEAVALYKQSIALAREATEAAPPELKAIYRSHLGGALSKYAAFLLDVNPLDSNFQSRALENLSEAEAMQKTALEATDSLDEEYVEIENAMATIHRLQARIAQLRNDDPTCRRSFEDAIQVYTHILEREPYRFSIHMNRIECANAYGDYLLNSKATPGLIELQYRTALNSIDAICRSPQLVQLEQDGQGLQYYRLGLVAIARGDSAEAKKHFRHCVAIRLKGYEDAIASSVNVESALREAVALGLAQGRAGMKAELFHHVKQLISLANSQEFKGHVLSQADVLQFSSAAMGVLADRLRLEGDPDADSTFVKAKKLLLSAIDRGYSDIDYVRTDLDFKWISDSKDWPDIEQIMLAKTSSK